MASKILLISANRCATPDPVFPLGLSHLNAALRRAGHDTRWLDCHANGQSLEQALTDYRPDFVGVSLRNIDDVLIRRRATYFDALSGICQTVRRLNPCPVVLGGSGFSIFPERLLKLSGADFGIRGEGESGLASLLAALENGRDDRTIPGLVWRHDGEIRMNPARASAFEGGLEPADRPRPLVSHYLQASGMLNLQTQRGCAHGCCYCTYPLIEGRAHRRRSPEAVADELAQFQAAGAKYAFIVDSVFNTTPRHVLETCEAIIRRRLSVRWGCFLRPQGLTPELMQVMARAGLAHAEFGSDSFCDEVLAEYGKRFTFDDILRATELARNAGVDACHFLICGGPGETSETLRTSYQNSRRLDGAVVLAVVGMRIYPGTPLCERAVREGVLADHADLLTPAYYVAPGLTADAIFGQLQDFAQRSPNWIVGDPTPEYARLVGRLRSRGVVGPLWSYFAMLQRILPRPTARRSS